MLQMSENDLHKILKKVKSKDIQEKYPELAGEIEKTLKEFTRIHKRLAGLEMTVNKLWADKVGREMGAR